LIWNVQEQDGDPGVADKRLLVRQSEFFGALQAMRRQGNTLRVDATLTSIRKSENNHYVMP